MCIRDSYKAYNIDDSIPPQKRAFNQMVRQVGPNKFEVVADFRNDYKIVMRPDMGGMRMTQRGAVDEFYLGRSVVAQSGCEACHKIGGNGNDGPGPELTTIGSRLPADAIARTLVNPTEPMPSFAALPAKQFDDAVAFLSALK